MAFSRQSTTISPCTTPEAYAGWLLESLGLGSVTGVCADGRSASELWAQSGAMWLSGHADTLPMACPAPLALCAQGVWLALCSAVPVGLATEFNAFQLLGERAAIAGYSRNGRTSPGGACHLYQTHDSVLALNLARDTDDELLPAWLERPALERADLADVLPDYSSAHLLQRARLLGLAAAVVAPPRREQHWYRANRLSAPAAAPDRKPLVIDLSSLWAGPLCGQLLSQCGARVIKVESESRPDGARNGPEAFFHLMNSGKESVALDLRTESDRRLLRSLLSRADIVIESARPRGLEQMGILAEELLQESPGKVWLSITGYGRRSPMGEWIAYGDDAGVATGLSWLMGGESGDPVFCGDAIADPLTGLHGALLAWAFWRSGGGVLLDLPLSSVVSHCIQAGSGSGQSLAAAQQVALPRAREVAALARELGTDTEQVIGELCRGAL